MSFGLFGQLSTESATMLTGKHDVAEDVLADAAYAEMAEITHEADMQAASMAQAMVIADQLDAQAVATESMMQQPELVNPATVVLARESMNMALLALGTEADTTLSTESMQSSPLQAMEVTQEGIKDVSKKIYESIKQIFVKIGQSIKKLVARVVVAMTNIEKKAESLYNKYKDMKLTKNTDTDENSIKETIYGPVLAFEKLKANNGGDNERAVANTLATNVRGLLNALKTYEDNLAATVDDIATASGDTALTADQITANTEKFVANAKDALEKLTGVQSNMISSEDMPDDVPTDLVKFIPTYFKKDVIHGVMVYVDVNKEEAITSVDSLKGVLKLKSYAYTVDKVDSSAKLDDKGVVLGRLKSDYKSANKAIKAIADERMKDLDKLIKAASNNAKNSSGVTIVNKLRANEFNKIRTVAAGHFINQIFSAVNMYKNSLAFNVKMITEQYSAE